MYAKLCWARVGSITLAVAVVAVATVATGAERADAGSTTTVEVVLSGENNRLNAYDAETGEKFTVIPSAADDPDSGLDINAEICVVPEGVPWKPAGETWFIAGEDTEQNSEPGVIKQGWGVFRLTGDTLTELAATQVAKFVPDSFVTESDNPENYGCGVLPDGRVVTGDVGDQLPQEPATGQLVEWFIDESHIGEAIGPAKNDFVRIPHCKIDVTIGTAGGIEVDGDTIYIASNRPDLMGVQAGGVLAFDTTIWPTGETADAGCGRADSTGEQLADSDKVGRSLFIPQVVGLTVTPSDIVDSGRDTFYVSSVFTGQVAEYGKDGIFQRFVVTSTGQFGGINPFGLAVTSDGTLWVADIGLDGPGPGPGLGSVVRVRFDEAGAPSEPEVIDEMLEFPDGLGVVALAGSASSPATPSGVEADDAVEAGVAAPATVGDRSLPATGAETSGRSMLIAVTALAVALVGVALRRRVARL